MKLAAIIMPIIMLLLYKHSMQGKKTTSKKQQDKPADATVKAAELLGIKTSEALKIARSLGITPEQLHQMVLSGKIKGIK
jgi:predicted Rossmann fold nucleotide-binding protein DprA/Smf involved in DNA uptake